MSFPIPGAGGDASAVIQVSNVSKSFGKTRALQEISFNVSEHRVLGLLGPNGAGKTTLIRILSTLLPPDHGLVRIAGYDVVRQSVAVRFAIGLVGQSAAVDESLSGRENLSLIGHLYRLSSREVRVRTHTALDRLALAEVADRPVRTYSGGMRRRLDIAVSLIGQPLVLLLDEPTTGLDPHARQELWSFLRELVDAGTTLLLTTQQLDEADQFANDIVVIDHGRVIAADTPAALKARIGTEVVEVTLAERTQLDMAATVLESLELETPVVDRTSNVLRIKVRAGTNGLVEVVRRLDAATIAIADITLQRPSLDDVFLSLTDHVGLTVHPAQKRV